MKLLSFVLILFVSIFSTTTLQAGEKSTYSFSWLDSDKEVYVLQNRRFSKQGRMHLNAGYGMTLSGAFVDATSIQGKVGFFLTEEIGLEVMYAKNEGVENEAFQSVLNNGGAGSTPFRRIIDNYYSISFVWSPFYAKINTFNKIVYVDWLLNIGYGKLVESNNKDTVNTGTAQPDITEHHDGIVWGTALKFYINEMFHVRLDLTGIYYEAQKALDVSTDETAFYSNYDLSLSIGANLF